MPDSIDACNRVSNDHDTALTRDAVRGAVGVVRLVTPFPSATKP